MGHGAHRRPWAVVALGLALARGALSPRAVAQPSTAGAELSEAAALEQEIETLAKDGKFDLALGKAARALALRQKVLAADDYRVGSSLDDLGALYVLIGDLVRAAPLLEQAVQIQEHARPGQKELANALENLAALYAKRGEHARAIPLYERALAICEQALGPSHADSATAKRALAMALGPSDPARTETLLRSALDVHDHAGDARGAVLDLLSLCNLRAVQNRLREPATEELYRQALDRGRKAFGADDLGIAQLWLALANFHRTISVGAWGTAEQVRDIRKLANEQYAETERILLLHYGPRHPELANLYSDWAKHAQAENDFDRAVALRTKANDIEEEHLAAVMATGSESVKLAYLSSLAQHAEDSVAVGIVNEWHLLHHQGARRLATTTILRRKGRALDALAESQATLRARLGPEEQRLLDELLATRAELSTAVTRGPGSSDAASYLGRMAALQRRAAELEAEVSRRSAEFRASNQPVTIEAVQARIPENAALLELIEAGVGPSHLADVRSSDSYSRRYVAFVLKRHGGICFAAMDEAETVDKLVSDFRRVLGDPKRHDVGDIAWRLYASTLARVEACLGGVDRLLISPDGMLNLVPFGALMDQKGFLAERYEISYLSSGRDLLRYGLGPAPRSAPVIVANPDFGPRSSGSGPKAVTRGVDLSRLFFPPLPGTAEEAATIATVAPSAVSFSRERATKTALEGVHGPEFLHVATHGFFLTGDSSAPPHGRALELVQGSGQSAKVAVPPQSFVQRGPLLRSGLALAGANRHDASSADDGILTALEVSSLDLYGTELVTLSACETGLGEPQDAEGVFGLRRALVIAGADSQLMSLWKVDDAATRDLMIDVYRRLLGGQSRSEALRDAQRTMLAKDATAHPFYWAAFILSGDPGPLRHAALAGRAGADGAGGVPKVEPGAHGCGCRVGASPPSPALADAGLLAAAVALGAWRRRLRSRRASQRSSS